MRKITLFLLVLSFLIIVISCKASEEQIKETEMSIKKEQLLQDMHEDEVIELVKALEEKAHAMDYYYFVKTDENHYALSFDKNIIRELPETKKLWDIHNQYHKVWYDEENDEMNDLFFKEYYKWNIVDGKVRKYEDGSQCKKIQNTICPFCAMLIDIYNSDTEETDNEAEEFEYSNYVLEYSKLSHKPYFDKIHLFGYCLQNPTEIVGYEDAAKQFELSQMKLYTLKKLIDSYNKEIEKAAKNDEFGLNGDVENYKKSLKGVWVKIKAKIQNIEEVSFTDKTTRAVTHYWKVTVFDEPSEYEMIVYFKKHTDLSNWKSVKGGWLPSIDDMKKIKKNDSITFVTQLYTDETKEVYYRGWLFSDETDLHFGYSEILEIK